MDPFVDQLVGPCRRAEIIVLMLLLTNGDTARFVRIGTIALLLAAPVAATASECVGLSLPTMLQIAPTVFSGTVETIEYVGTNGEIRRTTFRVRRVFNGKKAERIAIDQWAQMGMTDFFRSNVVVGGTYSVFVMDNRANSIRTAPPSALVARGCDVHKIDAPGERRLAAEIGAAKQGR